MEAEEVMWRSEKPKHKGEPGEANITVGWSGLEVNVWRTISLDTHGDFCWHIEIQGPSNYYSLERARKVAALWMEAVLIAEELEESAPDLSYLVNKSTVRG